MSMQINNLFPLSIVHDKIEMKEQERELLVNEIKSMYQKSELKNNPNNAWTGDVHGYEFLFSNPKFSNLCSLISVKITEYLKLLSINPDILDVYFQRSWATLTEED